MGKLILIDGSSILSGCFFGSLPKEYMMAKTEDERKKHLPKIMQTKGGMLTNGVYTMARTMLNIINRQKPTHLAVAWDVTRNTFRKKMYSEYKANRSEKHPELRSQFLIMQDLLDAMDVAQFQHENYEADDIIGTLAKAHEKDVPTYIYSKDQDVLQLVSEYTRCWLITKNADEFYKELSIDRRLFNIPDNVFEYTPDYVREHYGVEPIQIIDRKALEGDPSDNIPGVKGVGEKAVIPLLKEFGSVEWIYQAVENLEEAELKMLFKEIGITRSPLAYLLKVPKNSGEIVGKEAAFLSKRLATIETQIKEFRQLPLMELELNLDQKGMQEKFKELEFHTLMEKIKQTA